MIDKKVQEYYSDMIYLLLYLGLSYHSGTNFILFLKHSFPCKQSWNEKLEGGGEERGRMKKQKEVKEKEGKEMDEDK